jgi:hypothetical protein
VDKRAGRTGILGAVAPYSWVPLYLQISETCILIRLLRMYFPWNGEFGSASTKLRIFGGGGGLNTQPPLPGTPLIFTELDSNFRALISVSCSLQHFVQLMYEGRSENKVPCFIATKINLPLYSLVTHFTSLHYFFT